MGRYSRLLSAAFLDVADVQAGQRVLDVGCGPGALTGELVDRLGAGHVAAVDPMPAFVDAAMRRHPGVDVRRGSAEALPFDHDSVDAALAQLVVHFMSDPIAGIAEMARVTRPDGVVAASVWDHGSGQGPLGVFWAAARELDPATRDESSLAGAREGDLARLFRAAGLGAVEQTAIQARVEHPTFDEWWAPFTEGGG